MHSFFTLFSKLNLRMSRPYPEEALPLHLVLPKHVVIVIPLHGRNPGDEGGPGHAKVAGSITYAGTNQIMRPQ